VNWEGPSDASERSKCGPPCTIRAGDGADTALQRGNSVIAIDHSGKLVSVSVLGEFVLADYKEFEDMVRATLAPGGKVSLLIDLRQMAGFTVDVAWEDIKYTRSHPDDFDKIAVVTDSQWMIWSAWLSQMFINADLQVFDDDAEARDWLELESK